MQIERGHLGILLLFVIVGGILGSVLGMFLSELFPPLSVITKSMSDFLTVDLQLIKVAVRLNFSSLVGIVAGIIVFLKV